MSKLSMDNTIKLFRDAAREKHLESSYDIAERCEFVTARSIDKFLAGERLLKGPQLYDVKNALGICDEDLKKAMEADHESIPPGKRRIAEVLRRKT